MDGSPVHGPGKPEQSTLTVKHDDVWARVELSALRANGWNVSVTARALGMSRQVLTRMMGRHDLRVRELKK